MSSARPPLSTSVKGASGRPLITGLGPHGERPASPEMINLTPEAMDEARKRPLKVAIVLHTTTSDWSKRQITGIEDRLSEVGAVVIDVVDCQFDRALQVAAINRLVRERPDAIIGIPLGGSAVAEAFRPVSTAGIRLILLDNAPPGLLPETHYVSVVSSDNFELGQIAAALLSPHIPRNGSICVVAYKIDFFATAQREIGFRMWVQRKRPDVSLSQVKFATPSQVGEVISSSLGSRADLDGLFVVWDDPATEALKALEARSRPLVMTTVDLGSKVASALADGQIVRGVAAQRPYEQGCAAASTTIAALTGKSVPPWIVLPGLAVTSANVANAYRTVGGAPASPELLARARA
jgi:ribose transport system substrate-binding protein